jgi:hypothetical protein
MVVYGLIDMAIGRMSLHSWSEDFFSGGTTVALAETKATPPAELD